MKKVAILGLGHWYHAYGIARSLAESSRAKLVAVADPDERKRNEFASTFGLESYSDYRKVLDNKDIDIVAIVAPVAMIPEYFIASVEAGKHILLGKPIAMNMDQANQMEEALKRSQVKVATLQGGFKFGMKGIKDLIDAGTIGEVKVLHAVIRMGIAEDWYHSGTPGWYADPSFVPGGSFIDEGIYSIDQLMWLADSDISEIKSAYMANLVHKDIIPLEDWSFATFGFANGAIGTLESSWTIVTPRKTKPSPKGNGVTRLEIIGTKGEIIQDGLRNPSLGILGEGYPNWTFIRNAPEVGGKPAHAVAEHLIDCIEKNLEPVASFFSAKRAFEASLAAYECAKRGTPVKLAPVKL